MCCTPGPSLRPVATGSPRDVLHVLACSPRRIQANSAILRVSHAAGSGLFPHTNIISDDLWTANPPLGSLVLNLLLTIGCDVVEDRCCRIPTRLRDTALDCGKRCPSDARIGEIVQRREHPLMQWRRNSRCRHKWIDPRDPRAKRRGRTLHRSRRERGKSKPTIFKGYLRRLQCSLTRAAYVQAAGCGVPHKRQPHSARS